MRRCPPSVIDTDRRITYLHFTSTVKWSTIYHHEMGKGVGRCSLVSESSPTSPPSSCSSLSVGLFQGAIFVLAGLLAPYMTDSAPAGLSCAGNILIFAIGTNLLGLPNIRVANFLPALVIAVL